MPEPAELRIEQRLKEAKKNKKDYGDIKYFCRPDDIALLLDNGADPKGLNAKQVDHGFVHTVRYQGFLFVTATDSEVPAFAHYLLSRN